MNTEVNNDKAREIARQVMNDSDRTESLQSAVYGQYIIFAVSGIFLLNEIIYFLLTYNPFILYSLTPFVIIYFVLGYIYYRNPFVISSSALGIYLFMIVLAAIANPHTVFEGLILKLIIISGLSWAMYISYKFRQEIVSTKKEQGLSNIIDTEF